jgi:hypothetical protein
MFARSSLFPLSFRDNTHRKDNLQSEPGRTSLAQSAMGCGSSKQVGSPEFKGEEGEVKEAQSSTCSVEVALEQASPLACASPRPISETGEGLDGERDVAIEHHVVSSGTVVTNEVDAQKESNRPDYREAKDSDPKDDHRNNTACGMRYSMHDLPKEAQILEPSGASVTAQKLEAEEEQPKVEADAIVEVSQRKFVSPRKLVCSEDTQGSEEHTNTDTAASHDHRAAHGELELTTGSDALSQDTTEARSFEATPSPRARPEGEEEEKERMEEEAVVACTPEARKEIREEVAVAAPRVYSGVSKNVPPVPPPVVLKEALPEVREGAAVDAHPVVPNEAPPPSAKIPGLKRGHSAAELELAKDLQKGQGILAGIDISGIKFVSSDDSWKHEVFSETPVVPGSGSNFLPHPELPVETKSLRKKALLTAVEAGDRLKVGDLEGAKASRETAAQLLVQAGKSNTIKAEDEKYLWGLDKKIADFEAMPAKINS